MLNSQVNVIIKYKINLNIKIQSVVFIHEILIVYKFVDVSNICTPIVLLSMLAIFQLPH